MAEAWDRIQISSDEDAESIGPALLFFAVVSTVMNMGLLALYQRWHKKGAKASSGKRAQEELEGKGKEAPDEAAEPSRRGIDPTTYFEFCTPCRIQAGVTAAAVKSTNYGKTTAEADTGAAGKDIYSLDEPEEEPEEEPE